MRGKAHLGIGLLAGIQAAILFHIPITLEGMICSALCALLPDLDEENSTLSNHIVSPKISKRIRILILLFITMTITLLSVQFFLKVGIVNITVLYKIALGFSILLFFLLQSWITNKLVKKILMTVVGGAILIGAFCFKLLWMFFIIGGIIAFIPWLKHRGWTHTVWAVMVIFLLLKQLDHFYQIKIAYVGAAAYASHIFLGDLFTYTGVKLFYPLSYTFKIPILSTGSAWGNFIEWIIVIGLSFLILQQLL